jgi:hypothetical protein
MTQDQKEQFKKFGCVSRSLIILADRKQRPFASWDDYCLKFGHLFPEGHYGAIFTSQIVEVTRAQKLASCFESFRRYAEIQDAHAKGRGVLIISEIDLNQGQTGIIRHCSVLENIDAASFTLIVPSQAGNDHVMPFTVADWDAKLCHGLVFYDDG